MKKNRTIQASDLEWEQIRARARDAGMNVSKFIMACAEIPDEGKQTAISEPLSNAEMHHLYDLVKLMADQQAALNRPMHHVRSYVFHNKKEYLLNLRQTIHAIFIILKVQEWKENGGS